MRNPYHDICVSPVSNALFVEGRILLGSRRHSRKSQFLEHARLEFVISPGARICIATIFPSRNKPRATTLAGNWYLTNLILAFKRAFILFRKPIDGQQQVTRRSWGATKCSKQAQG